MKKIFFAFAMLLILTGQVIAKNPSFTTLHNLLLPFKPDVQKFAHTNDLRFFLCSTSTDMLMFDGISGQILWQLNFKDKLLTKSFENQFWNKEANVILLYDKDTKKGTATKYFIDGKTGEKLWENNSYLSSIGEYKLSTGFEKYYDPVTSGVLLPQKESVDMVNVRTGQPLWQYQYTVANKFKEFDACIMSFYDLVNIKLGKTEDVYLKVSDGKAVEALDPYFNQKKFLSNTDQNIVYAIPEKNCYVVLEASMNKVIGFTFGANFPSRKMKISAFENETNRQLWTNEVILSYVWDWINYDPMFELSYSEGKLIIGHEGLTIIDMETGNPLWKIPGYHKCMLRKEETRFYEIPFAAPNPVIKNNRAYVPNAKTSKVTCFSAQNGIQIWESKQLESCNKIQGFFADDQVVIVQYGGAAYINVGYPQSVGKPVVYKREYLPVDNFGLVALDAKTGDVIWDNNTIKKRAKDKLEYIVGTCYEDGKLYCTTNKNFLTIEPRSGNVLSSLPLNKQKLGDVWGQVYFKDKKLMILNAKNGIIKLDMKQPQAIVGSLKVPNVQFYSPISYLQADDCYQDYAIYTSGDVKKFNMKSFASINLDSMQINGEADARLLDSKPSQFSSGGEYFYTISGNKYSILKVKK